MERFILNELQEYIIQHLPIHFQHIIKINSLPSHHRDPFDRLLAAQSLIEGFAILSCDKAFDDYGVKRIW